VLYKPFFALTRCLLRDELEEEGILHMVLCRHGAVAP
jgi:hypothetical protein